MSFLSEYSQYGDLRDLVDIALLSMTVYWFLTLIRGTRTIFILVGISILLLAHIVAGRLNLLGFAWVMENLFSSAVVILVVLFQADIRTALANLGVATFRRENTAQNYVLDIVLQEVVKAANLMTKKRIGGTIVLEQETGLRNYTEKGVVLRAETSYFLIFSVFLPDSPLHDGALIINRHGKITAARCILPLSQRNEGAYGTRHRSALGLSEETDAVVLVVSEETGTFSLAFQGVLEQRIPRDSLENRIRELLEKKRFFGEKRI